MRMHVQWSETNTLTHTHTPYTQFKISSIRIFIFVTTKYAIKKQCTWQFAAPNVPRHTHRFCKWLKFLLVLFFCVLLQTLIKEREKNKNFCLLMCIHFFFLVSLRLSWRMLDGIFVDMVVVIVCWQCHFISSKTHEDWHNRVAKMVHTHDEEAYHLMASHNNEHLYICLCTLSVLPLARRLLQKLGYENCEREVIVSMCVMSYCIS